MSDKDLAAYADRRDEAAFVRLMARNSGLVYSSALRRTASPEFAEEVLQNVFVTLARKAQQLKTHPSISGWLYVATMHESAKVLSKESKRKQKMRDYQSLQQLASDSSDDSAPALDEALDKLPSSDRNLILQRFFEGRSYREISGMTGKSEQASRKQAERALGKLGDILRRRGIVASASLIGGVLSTQLGKAAPAALVSTASKNVLATVSATAAPGFLSLPIIAMTQSKIALATGLVVFIATAGTAFLVGRSHAVTTSDPNGRMNQFASSVQSADPGAGSDPTAEELSTRQLLRLLTHAENDLHRRELDSTARYQAELRLRQIPQTQLAEALRIVADEMPGGLARHLPLGRYLLEFWAEHQGAEAMAFAGSNFSPRDLRKTVGRILKPWADQNPHAALAWYRSTYDSDVKDRIQSRAEKEAQLRTIFGSWASGDALAAIAEYYRMTNPDECHHAVHGIVNGIRHEMHREEVLAFLTELDDQRLRLESIHRAAMVVEINENADALEAVALFGSANLPPDEARYAVHGIYESWNRGVDPEAAANWFVSQSMTDDPLGGRLSEIAGHWVNHDPEACHAWLSQFELDPGMDSNIASIALHFDMVGRRDIALDWQLKIVNKEAQASALQNTLNNWAKEDPDAARQWFETAGLDATVADAVEGMVTWNMP